MVKLGEMERNEGDKKRQRNNSDSAYSGFESLLPSHEMTRVPASFPEPFFRFRVVAFPALSPLFFCQDEQ
jgi:hypothetical protein